MAAHIVIEKFITLLIEKGYILFNIKPKKDTEGYIYVKLPVSYYIVSFILFGLGGVCLYALIFHYPKNEIVLAITITVSCLALAILSFLYVKNTQFKFNDREIIGQDLFKRSETILWKDCNFKPYNPIKKQIVLYCYDSKFKIHESYIGFPLLINFMAKKFKLSLWDLGFYH